MKKRVVWTVSLAGVLVGCLIFIFFLSGGFQDEAYESDEEIVEPYGHLYDSNGDIIASTDPERINVQKPYLKFYDENDKLIDSYTEEQIQVLSVDTEIYKYTKRDGEEPYAEFYDENGIIMDADEDMEKELNQLLADNKSVFVFRESSFHENLSVGKGRQFVKPQSLIIEPLVKFRSMSINLFDSVGKQVGRIESGNFDGGLKIPLTEYVREDEEYTIQLVNEATGRHVHILGGVVLF